MKKFIVASLIVSSLVLSTENHALRRPTPVHIIERGDALFPQVILLDKSKQGALINEEELESHYKKLLQALNVRNAENDAITAFTRGKLYFINTSDFNPKKPLTLLSPYYDKLTKACPTYYLVGTNPQIYVDSKRLERIELGKEPKPKTGTLLRWRSNVQRTPSVLAYMEAMKNYSQSWAKVMQPECLKKANIPHDSILPPVKAMHKVEGNTVYILNEKTFRVPAHLIPWDLYGQRLKTALAQKDPESDSLAAIKSGQLYLLSLNNGNTPLLSKEETNALSKVCPLKAIEGQDYANEGLYKAYYSRWNKVMLTACQVKAKQSSPTDNELIKLSQAKKRWATRESIGLSYQYQLVRNNQALNVVIKDNVLSSVIDSKTNKAVSLNQNLTVSGWFDTIQQWANVKPYRLEVNYHPKLGYPTDIKVQLNKNSGLTSYNISNLKI